MFYQEIKPGVFISNEQKIHFALKECPYCGRVDTLSHHKYTERCIDCGNIYNLYAVRRNQRLKNKMTLKTVDAHLTLLSTLKRHRDAGLKVPATLDEEYEATLKLHDTLHYLHKESAEIFAQCRVCLEETMCIRTSTGVTRCPACEATRKRYKYLYNSVDILCPEECDEFVSLITDYIQLSKRGGLIPHISRAIPKVQQRIVDLGGNRRIFYYKETSDEEM